MNLRDELQVAGEDPAVKAALDKVEKSVRINEANKLIRFLLDIGNESTSKVRSTFFREAAARIFARTQQGTIEFPYTDAIPVKKIDEIIGAWAVRRVD